MCECEFVAPEVLHALARCEIPYAWSRGTDRAHVMSILLTEALTTSADAFLLLSADLLLSVEAIDRLTSSPVLADGDCISGECPIGANELGEPPPDSAIRSSAIAQVEWTHTFFSGIPRATIQSVSAQLPEIARSPNAPWRPFGLPFIGEIRHGTYEYFGPDRAFWWRMRTLGGSRLWIDNDNSVERIRERRIKV